MAESWGAVCWGGVCWGGVSAGVAAREGDCSGWATVAAIEEMMDEWTQGSAVEGVCVWLRWDGWLVVSNGGSLLISTARDDDTSNSMLLRRKERRVQ